MSSASETFDRVLCGTDGGAAAEVALRQALTVLWLQAYGALLSAERLAGGRELDAPYALAP